MIECNPELQKRQSHVYGWFFDLYVEAMAMAVRRLCDNDARTVSLLRFLRFVKRDPSVISRAAYSEMFPQDMINASALPAEVKVILRDRIINKGYDATVGEEVLQPRGRDLSKEIRELEQLSNEIVGYANRRVAHFDKEPPSGM